MGRIWKKVGWRTLFQMFAKSNGYWNNTNLFCNESRLLINKTTGADCEKRCPINSCINIFHKMKPSRRLAIIEYVLTIVTGSDWYDLIEIKAAISSQLTKAERKLYEGE